MNLISRHKFSLTSLVLGNVRRNLKAHALASIGIITGIASFVFFLSLGAGIKNTVMTEILSSLPVNVIEASPRQNMIGFLSRGLGGVLSTDLNDDALEKIRSIPGVSDVSAEMTINVPMQVHGEFMGKRVVTDIIATGIDPRLVANDVAPGLKFEYNGDGPVPVLVSSQLLALYNSNVAPSLSLPRISPEFASKIGFTLVVGQSYFSGPRDYSRVREYNCRVVGISSRAVLAGITVPMEYAKRWTAASGGAAGGDFKYKTVYVSVKKPEETAAVASELEAMGFDVDKVKKLVGSILSWFFAVLGMLSVLIVTISAVGIMHVLSMAVRERRREIGVMRAVGATRRDVMTVYLGEAAVLGAASGVAGAAVGSLAACAADWAASRYLPEFAFKPTEFFLITPSILAASILLAVFFSVLGGLIPASTAARMDPSEAIRS